MNFKIHKKIALNSFFIISIMLFTACSNKSNSIDPFSQTDLVYEKPKVNYDEFESSMISLSNKTERHWAEYTQLLKERKHMKNKDLENHIPYMMGKRVSTKYRGYLGDFLKLLAAQSGYTLEFDNLKVIDTPLIAEEYHLTSVYDILRNVIDKYELDIKIKETDRVIVLSIKV